MIDLKYSGRSASLLAVLPLVCLPMAVTGQRVRENAVPLRNWATPLYWQANQAENAVQGSPLKAAPQLVFSANQVSANALTFIAITPCRLVDTRGAAAGFNGISPFSGPSIPAAGTITIPVQSPTEATSDTTPAPCGVIPSIAQAYSFNLTVVPPAAGAAVDYVSLWPAGSAQPFVSTLDDPQGAIVSNAVIVPAGPTSSPGYGGVSVYNHGPATTDVIIDMNGYYAAPTDVNNNTAIGFATLANNTTGTVNTAIGAGALYSNTTGSQNTASGAGALYYNTTGNDNAASGTGALYSNTTGSNNTASGNGALSANTTGNNNTATGQAALNANTTGSGNTGSGAGALQANTTGNQNTASGQAALHVNTTGYYNVATGAQALQSNTTGSNNTVSGQAAMLNNTTGCCNTAVGQAALNANTTANSNTAVGGSALQNNTTGNNNTAVGQGALLNNTTGVNNVAVGQNALNAITTSNGNSALGAGALSAFIGTQNTAVGNFALGASGGGVANVAVGWQALGAATGGNNNIAIGNQAAHNVTGNANNIHIGSQGNAADNNTIRIGTPGTQTSFFAAGVSGTTTGLSGAVNVVVDANGQLGTVSSSQRFKEDIQDMGEASSGLLRLRPVTFRYKQPYEDGSKPIDYGLIAEEVAQVYPDLAVRGADGQIQTVQYQKLTPMLLNEVQKQAQQIRSLEERLAALEAVLPGAPEPVR